MKNTAKFISMFLCLAMIFSVGLALVVNAAAVEAPSLSVKVIKTDDKEKFDKYIYSLHSIDQSVCKWNNIWENLRKSVQ